MHTLCTYTNTHTLRADEHQIRKKVETNINSNFKIIFKFWSIVTFCFSFQFAVKELIYIFSTEFKFMSFVWRMLSRFHQIIANCCCKDYDQRFCWNVSRNMLSWKKLQIRCKGRYTYCTTYNWSQFSDSFNINSVCININLLFLLFYVLDEYMFMLWTQYPPKSF